MFFALIIIHLQGVATRMGSGDFPWGKVIFFCILALVWFIAVCSTPTNAKRCHGCGAPLSSDVVKDRRVKCAVCDKEAKHKMGITTKRW